MQLECRAEGRRLECTQQRQGTDDVVQRQRRWSTDVCLGLGGRNQQKEDLAAVEAF